MPPSVRAAAKVLAGTWPRRLAWLALAAAVMLTALTGGFEAVPAAEPARVAAGEAVEIGPVRLAARSWTIRDDIATNGLEYAGAAAWLVVEADVTALTDATITFPQRSLGLPAQLGVDGEPDRVVLLADATQSPGLQPDLPARVALLWPLGDVPDPGDDLEVAYLRSRLSDSTIDAGRVWRADGVAAHATLPRDDATGDALVEEES
ncbi:hypothetical protein [Jiangella anatolica]|nr:hypothetical protein [Jiangella anatolica]